MHNVTLLVAALCLVTFGTLAVPGLTPRARAEMNWIVGDPIDEPRAMQLSVGTSLAGGRRFSLSPGAVFSLPIVDSGFIRPVNDSIYLEFGAFLAMYTNPFQAGFIPELGPRWNFHLTPSWDAFGTIKAGVLLSSPTKGWLRGGAGMVWYYGRPWGLRLETFGGLNAGAGVFIGIMSDF